MIHDGGEFVEVRLLYCNGNQRNVQKPEKRQGLQPARTVERRHIGLSSVLRPRQHSISYMGDGRTSSAD